MRTIRIAPHCGLTTSAGEKYAGDVVALPAHEAAQYVAEGRAVFVADAPLPDPAPAPAVAVQHRDPKPSRRR